MIWILLLVIVRPIRVLLLGGSAKRNRIPASPAEPSLDRAKMRIL